MSDPLRLEPAEADVLALDASSFAQALTDPIAQARYRRLSEAAAGGEVPPELVAPLQTMLELLFEKGRPSNRAVLRAIYARTPRGRQQSAASRQVNQALRTLRGQQLQDVRLAAGPSGSTLVLETDRCKLTLELNTAGARVSSLET